MDDDRDAGISRNLCARRSVDFLLEQNIAQIDEELKPVVRGLYDGLRKLGLDLLTPADVEYASASFPSAIRHASKSALRWNAMASSSGPETAGCALRFTCTTTWKTSTACSNFCPR